MLDPANIKPGMAGRLVDAVSVELFGETYGRYKLLAEALRAGPQTVLNWIHDRHPVPGPAAVAMRLLVERKQLGEMLG